MVLAYFDCSLIWILYIFHNLKSASCNKTTRPLSFIINSNVRKNSSLFLNINTTMKLHISHPITDTPSYNLTTSSIVSCSSSKASCHGYIQKMIEFYAKTGGWIMLAIILFGTACLVLSYLHGNMLKRMYYKNANKKILWSFKKRKSYERQTQLKLLPKANSFCKNGTAQLSESPTQTCQNTCRIKL